MHPAQQLSMLDISPASLCVTAGLSLSPALIWCDAHTQTRARFKIEFAACCVYCLYVYGFVGSYGNDIYRSSILRMRQRWQIYIQLNTYVLPYTKWRNWLFCMCIVVPHLIVVVVFVVVPESHHVDGTYRSVVYRIKARKSHETILVHNSRPWIHNLKRSLLFLLIFSLIHLQRNVYISIYYNRFIGTTTKKVR